MIAFNIALIKVNLLSLGFNLSDLGSIMRGTIAPAKFLFDLRDNFHSLDTLVILDYSNSTFLTPRTMA